MLPKENRLSKIRDFNLLVKHGRFFNGPLMSLKALELITAKNYFPPKEDPDEFQKHLKIAFAVGLKIAKSAVKRNRVRRLMREAIRLLLKERQIQRGWYLLFVAKTAVLESDYKKISQECVALLKKAGVLDN